MSLSERALGELRSAQRFFARTTSIFEEEDAGFAPNPVLYTVAGHIAHTADSVEWFIEGGFGSGWDLDFEALIAKARAVSSLAEAQAWLDRAFDHAGTVVGGASDEALLETMPDTSVMKDAPRIAVINGIVDHTAHHRGSLAVYARLLGKEPPMPYG